MNRKCFRNDDQNFKPNQRHSYDYYWIGLNDLQKTGFYEWIKTDGSECPDDCPQYDKFKFWAPGMPSDADGSRCTFMLFSDHLPGGETYGQEGKWVKGLCNKTGKFVCQLDPRKVTTNCPSGWTYRKMHDIFPIVDSSRIFRDKSYLFNILNMSILQ